MTGSTEVAALKERHHDTWAAGDYGAIARLIEHEGRTCAEYAGARAGMTVLDVATGTGNVAISAAQSGARVVGLDLTPELLRIARARAADAGVEVEWLPGDAEDLPFADASFDRVTSAFGVQFAPRHEVVAEELVRVTKPGGLVVLVNWAADGMIGELFKLMGRYLPAPPAFASSPARWGAEEHVRELFEDLGVRLAFERRTAEFPFGSGENWMAYFEEHYGPTIKAREAVGEHWAELRRETVALANRFLRVEPGNKHIASDYWVITAWRGE